LQESDIDSPNHKMISKQKRRCQRRRLRFCMKEKKMATNPRSKNGTLRRKHRARLRARGGECGICRGRLGPIHYDEPSDAQHPLSFVIDEIIPVSRWQEFGYDSPEAVAQDWSNLQAAHYCCNAAKSNRIQWADKAVGAKGTSETVKKINLPDGNW